MGDRKFSWYTIVHPDYEGWPADPLYRLVGPAIEQSGETTCDIYYRPNRKGGHTHNCWQNHLKKMQEEGDHCLPEGKGHHNGQPDEDGNGR